jgi:hypothetical protein
MPRLNLWYLPPAFFSLAGHGCGQRPAFPVPSVREGRLKQSSDADNAPREGELMSLPVIARSASDEAIQNRARGSGLLRFARNHAECADTDAIIGPGKRERPDDPQECDDRSARKHQVNERFPLPPGHGTENPGKNAQMYSGNEAAAFWSGRRGSNPRPRPWQGRALPLSYTRIRVDGAVRAADRQTYAKSGGRMQQGCDIESRTIFFRVPDLIRSKSSTAAESARLARLCPSKRSGARPRTEYVFRLPVGAIREITPRRTVSRGRFPTPAEPIEIWRPAAT